jgi:gliding motility-associated-like protein
MGAVGWSTNGTGSFDDITLLAATYTPSVEDIDSGMVMLTLTAFTGGDCENVSDTMSVTMLDNQPPTIECPQNVLQKTDSNSCVATVEIPVPDVADNCGIESLFNDYTGTENASGIYPLGTTLVYWTVTDISGNIFGCQMTVTVYDSKPPDITCPDDIIANTMEDSCWASVPVPQPLYWDNCGIQALWNSYNGTPDASDIYPFGTTTVTWYVRDIYSNSDSCTMNITVVDNIPPGIECPPDMIVNNGQDSCSAYVAVPQPLVNDNCGIYTAINDYNWTTDASDVYPVGTTLVTWYVPYSAQDSISCIMSITVIDAQPPEIVCPESILQNTDSTVCSTIVTVPIPVVSDNCGIASLVNDFNGTDDASGRYPVGTTVVKWWVTDIYGITGSCSMTVTVADSIKPQIICPDDIIAGTDPDSCWALVPVPPPDTWDNCGIDAYWNSYNGTPDASDSYPAGTTTVIWYVRDIYGNMDTCSMNITVVDDIPPDLTCPEDITVNVGIDSCSAWINVPPPIVIDNCGVLAAINNYNWTIDASDVYPLGTTVVNWYVPYNNSDTISCTMTITVVDNQLPTIICPEDIVQNIDPGSCAAAVVIPPPEAYDNCGVLTVINNITGTGNASGVYTAGTTIIKWLITDVNGNLDSCEMSITIIDNSPPSIICPDNITSYVGADSCWAFVNVPPPDYFDNCGIDFVWNSYNGTNDASDDYPVGLTNVTWYVRDIFDNVDSCSMNITVIDNVLPVIICPDDIVVNTGVDSCSAFVPVPLPLFSDNCGIDTVWNDYNGKIDATDVYSEGITIVTWTAIDFSGNRDSCSTSIQVVDRQKPRIFCQDIILPVDTGKCVTYANILTPPMSDNCGIDRYFNTYNNTPDASDYYRVGVTPITWIIIDIHGNIDSCRMNLIAGTCPIARDDSVSIFENTTVDISVLDNDFYCVSEEGDQTVTVIRDPQNGMYHLSGNDGIVTYVPDHAYDGADSLWYELCDMTDECDTATVYITIRNVNDPPVAVDDYDTTLVNYPIIIDILKNDYEPDGDSMTLKLLGMPKFGSIEVNEDNRVTYSPDYNFMGIDFFTYVLYDDAIPPLTDTALVTVMVHGGIDFDALFIIYNALTPNFDGVNDYWKIKGIELYPDNQIIIMDRWGEIIRTFDGYNNGNVKWDGTNENGRMMPNGVYYYIIKLNYNTEASYKGWIMLYR